MFGKLRYLQRGHAIRACISYGPIMKMALEVAARSGGERTAACRWSRPTRSSRSTATGWRRSSPTTTRWSSSRSTRRSGGLAAQTKQIAWDIAAPCSLYTFTLQDEFIHFYGSHADLLRAHGLEPGRILSTIQAARNGSATPTLIGASAG